ncbi:MAG TPA: primosomal protein N' [Candidatus Wallbacteria bacterium]|nr:primosomal protein N' [Candidatus Wallbacteria bacterium]
MYCKVAVSIPVDQLYTYKIPDKYSGLVTRGSRVLVNIKNQADPVAAYVISCCETCDYDPSLVKPVYDIVEGAPLPEDLMRLSEMISEKYLCAQGMALEMIFPPSLSYQNEKIEPFYDFNRKADVFEAIKDRSLNKTDRLVIQFLYNHGASDIKNIEKSLLSTRVTVKNSLSKLIGLKYAAKSLDPRKFDYGAAGPLVYKLGDDRGIEFTPEQKAAIANVTHYINKGEYHESLIFGVTGSGKTEVYIEIIKEILNAGKTAIVLVPEIALTEHLKHRYQKAFDDRLAIWHSLVTKAQKDAIYSQIADGKIKILLGARSAVFAPFDQLGCVIIDEEHDSSYKQDSAIKYDAREVAKMRLKISNGVLVSGTATPSIDSYHDAVQNGRCGEFPSLIKLEKRVENRPMPECHIVDMGREFIDNKNKSMFSALLSEKINDRLQKRQQSLLFLNRRGHSTFVLCRACGYVVKCDDCSVSMTFHMQQQTLLCHYCSAVKKAPSRCPQCDSQYIRFFGAGTEKVEEEFRIKFPDARVARLDSDILTSKKISSKILDDFAKKKIDVLIGTQMIAKGFDFHNITLVGVISADTMLNMPDMFASERTFQILCQVIGRTGRGETEGECVIQTYNPDNYAITCAAASDFTSFYQNEAAVRKGLFYPPFSKMIKISFAHPEETLILETAAALAGEINERIKSAGEGGIRLTGPAPSLVAKIQNIYRYNIFIYAGSEEIIRDSLLDILKKYSFTNKKQCVKISVDVSPNNTF